MDKLTKKNAKLKGKLSTDTFKCNYPQMANTKDIGTMTVQFNSDNYSVDINRLKIDRDFYHQEYLKLLNHPIADGEINLLRKQLTERDCEIKSLKRQLESQHLANEIVSPCRAVEASLHRAERERIVLQDTIKRLNAECEDLRENLRISTTNHHDQINQDENEMEKMRKKISQLECENISLKTIEATTKSNLALIKEEKAQLQTELAELNDENIKLRTSSKHLRVLQEQTENALIEHQNRLTFCERQRDEVESRLNVIDSSRTNGFREIGELRAEITRLKSMNSTLAIEKDKLIVSLNLQEKSKLDKIYMN